MHKMDWLKTVMLQADNGEPFPNEEQRDCLRRMNRLTANSMGMSYRLENALTPYVTFLIMPIFALANAGVGDLSLEYINIFHYSSEIGSVGMGVFFGLLIGKPLGSSWQWGAVRSAWPRCLRAPTGGCSSPWRAWAVSGSRCRSSWIRSPIRIRT